MNKNNTIRIDKFLWAMRLCKTRKIAYHACNKRKIKINNITSKASKIIKIDDSIEYNKNNQILRVYPGAILKQYDPNMYADLIHNIEISIDAIDKK